MLDSLSPLRALTLIPLQVPRAPLEALVRLELWASLERGDLQAHQGLLGPQGPQLLLDHPMPRSSMVSSWGPCKLRQK